VERLTTKKVIAIEVSAVSESLAIRHFHNIIKNKKLMYNLKKG
jgi:hypothetical protein